MPFQNQVFKLPFECNQNSQVDKKTFKLNFTYGNWWWQFACREEWTPDSITKIGCVVNIKSEQEDELFKICIGLFMIWWKPKLDVQKSTFETSKLVTSLVYQDFDFVLKSPRTTIMKQFFSVIRSKFNSKFSENVSKSSFFSLGDV